MYMSAWIDEYIEKNYLYPFFERLSELPIMKETDDLEQSALPLNNYIRLTENTAILRGSFQQAIKKFDKNSRDKQCTGVAAVACVAFFLQDPNYWKESDLDNILTVGDEYYRNCIEVRDNPDIEEINAEYLAITELLPYMEYDNRKVSISINYESAFNGHIDNDNSDEGFLNLKNALIYFFTDHSYGILTANSASVAVHSKIHHDSTSFWLFDSHGRGPKGCKAPSKGVSCCMRFNDINDLYNLLRRNFYSRYGDTNFLNLYSLTPIKITLDNNPSLVDENNERPIPVQSVEDVLESPRLSEEHSITSQVSEQHSEGSQILDEDSDEIQILEEHLLATRK